MLFSCQKKLWIFLQMINIRTKYSNDCPTSEETTEDGNVVWSEICDKVSFLSWGLISEEALLLSPPTKSVTVSVLKVLKYFSASRPSGSMVAKRTSFEKWSPLVMVLAILIFLFLQTQYPWTFWQTSACALSIENNFFLVLDLTIWYLNIIRTGSRGAQYLSTKLSELGIQSNTTMRIRSAKYATPFSPKFFFDKFHACTTHAQEMAVYCALVMTSIGKQPFPDQNIPHQAIALYVLVTRKDKWLRSLPKQKNALMSHVC